MKGLLFWGTLTLLNIEFKWVPKPDLLLVMGVMIVLDFITGLIKAVILGQDRTSSGFRKTITKFLQYGGAILIGMGISYLGIRVEEYNSTWVGVAEKMSWFNNGMIIFIIFIEIISVLENLYAANSKSLFARYAIKPALRVLTIQIKQNPLIKMTIETEDDSVTKQSIRIDEKPADENDN